MCADTNNKKLVESDGFLNIEEMERRIAEGKRSGWPNHGYPHIPLTDRLFLHEKMLFDLSKADMTEEQLQAAFPNVSSAIEKILDREVMLGHISDYRRGKIRYFRITDVGKKFLRFSQGIAALRHGIPSR